MAAANEIAVIDTSLVVYGGRDQRRPGHGTQVRDGGGGGTAQVTGTLVT